MSMNNDTQLDSYETALLAELRREVSERPAPETTAVPVRRPRRRRLIAGGATVVAASVVAVFGLGAGGGSPAYAVETNSAGDVTVTVHRLDDAAGLENALRAQGIDADVSYDADGIDATYGIDSGGQPSTGDQAPGGDAGASGNLDSQGGSGHTESGPNAGAPDEGPCDLGADPATLTRQGSDWVLSIPAGSPLQERHVLIGTDRTGALAVQYAGDQPGSTCGMVTMTRGTPGS
jgi:hypothetical protein